MLSRRQMLSLSFSPATLTSKRQSAASSLGRVESASNKTKDNKVSLGTILLIILIIVLLGGFSGLGGGPFYGTGYYGGTTSKVANAIISSPASQAPLGIGDEAINGGRASRRTLRDVALWHPSDLGR
jgi:hypothetical protein